MEVEKQLLLPRLEAVTNTNLADLAILLPGALNSDVSINNTYSGT